MIKRIFILFGILLLLVVALLVTAVIVIDPNDYKDKIRDLARDATGRELHIVDDMKLSVFPWLGVEFGELRLSNADGFGAEPFARIDHARVKVRLLPLIQRRIEIDTVTLEGLELRLAVAGDGRTNWEDLVTAAAAPADREPAPPAPSDAAFALPAMLTISGLDIRDAALYWRDRAAGQSFDITGIDLESGRIAANRPVDVRFDFEFSSEQPAVSGEIEFAARVTARFDDEIYQLEGLRLRTRVDGDAVPAGSLGAELNGDLDLDLGRQTFEMSPLALSMLDLDANGELHGEQILGEPRIIGTIEIAEFDPRSLLNEHFATTIDTADPAVLKNGSAALAFEAGTRSASIRRLEVRLDDSTLRGSVSLRDFTGPAVGFDLELDRIDVDRYLPPGDEAPAATPATAPAAALELPLETLRALEIDGGLGIGTLTAGGLTMSEFQARIAAKDGVIAVKPISAALYGGRYRGSVRLDARGEVPGFSIDERLTGVQAAPLLADMLDLDLISGVADFHIAATARGTGEEQLLRSANGTASFSFRDGAVQGFNIAQTIRETRARLEGKTVNAGAPQETDFTELTGSARIENGVVRNDDLRGNSPFLRVAGSGQVDLVEQQLDYRLKVRVVETPAGQGAALDDVKGIDIPIRIRGPLTAPDIKADADILRELLRGKLSPKVDELREQLEDKAGQRKQELEEQLQEKLDDQLRKLLR